MFLASILALWLLPAPRLVLASNTFPEARGDGTFTPSSLQSTSSQSQSEPNSSSSGQASSKSQPNSTAPATADSTPKHKHKKKNPPAPATDSDAPPKKVVTHGSTEDPSTHLAPSMSDEQIAKTRATNAESLTAAQSNLQKVNGRTLSAEQQETADQIRKFVEQSKAADQEGDLQRAATLANKAKLLSDSLEETTRPK